MQTTAPKRFSNRVNIGLLMIILSLFFVSPAIANSTPKVLASTLAQMVIKNDYSNLSSLFVEKDAAKSFGKVLEWKFKDSSDRSKIYAYFVERDDAVANERLKRDSEERGIPYEPLSLRVEKLLAMYKGLGGPVEYKLEPVGTIVIVDGPTIASLDYGLLEGKALVTTPTPIRKQ